MEEQLRSMILTHLMSSDNIIENAKYIARDNTFMFLSFYDWLCFHSQDVIELVSYWDARKQENVRVFVPKGSRSVVYDALTFEWIFDYWLRNIFYGTGK